MAILDTTPYSHLRDCELLRQVECDLSAGERERSLAIRLDAALAEVKKLRDGYE